MNRRVAPHSRNLRRWQCKYRRLPTQDWPASYEATGTVRARTTATISSKVMGYVQQVSVQVGDRVRQGQTLITLDARDLDVSLRRAEAGGAEVQSAIPELENATAAAKANLDLAQTTFKRMEELATKKSISNQEMDEASARLKAAQANYDMVRSRRAQVDSKMAVVEQEVRAAGIIRDYAKLAAPFSGVVITRTVCRHLLGRATAHRHGGGQGLPLPGVPAAAWPRHTACCRLARGRRWRGGRSAALAFVLLGASGPAPATRVVPLRSPDLPRSTACP